VFGGFDASELAADAGRRLVCAEDEIARNRIQKMAISQMSDTMIEVRGATELAALEMDFAALEADTEVETGVADEGLRGARVDVEGARELEFRGAQMQG
jgi:hypothetical protein